MKGNGVLHLAAEVQGGEAAPVLQVQVPSLTAQQLQALAVTSSGDGIVRGKGVARKVMTPYLEAACAGVSLSSSSWWSTAPPACSTTMVTSIVRRSDDLQQERHHLSEASPCSQLEGRSARHVQGVRVATTAKQGGHCGRLGK